eukprot:CAMPEP_0201632110 /NCGR_PEP_ID=MMETSP0493-20130528/5854_1 /ASSEMBLY_ACC=CAM_ASM_000838 /TAXON_ID=420259 /ORGANISM="Thalassiosira gravida, Strain GMp14c1" /LENGTH=462 /DNA_ID=CAMNT_0048103561 /DNA_START=113 /DNA_END=1501 /DNA_ORIENTATION=+
MKPNPKQMFTIASLGLLLQSATANGISSIKAAADQKNSRKLTNTVYETLASYGLTLDEFKEVRDSESPADFGGLPSSGDTQQLWLDAAVFEYEVPTYYGIQDMSTSPHYHPYLVCSTHPDLSGSQRESLVNDTFQNTPGVFASHLYTDGNMFHNDETISCGVLRAFNDTIAKVYEANPNAEEYMTVNPLSSSMKMMENTVEILRSWFSGDVDGGGVVSINEEDGTDINSPSNMGRMEVKQMGLHMVLCPGVQDFEVEDVPDEEIADSIKGFITEEGGGTVEKLSFYYHRVSGMDGPQAVHTERMDEWSAVISQVATNWTKSDGSNACLDTIIGEYMDFDVTNRNLEVSSKFSTWEGIQVGKTLGFSEEDLETCIWYLTYGLALSPMVCTLEPRTKVKTLCKDGTSDLSKCTAGADAGGGGNDGNVGVGPPSSASSRIWLGPWRSSGALVALCFFSFLGFAIL